MGVILTLLSAFVFTEFVGYWLHILLHSNKIEFLSRNHMIHHLVIYGPNKPQQHSTEYLQSTYGRANVLGIGLEWILPVGVILALLWMTFHSLGIRIEYRVIFVATALGWGFLIFAYMHDAMHIKGFWMEGSRLFGRWFMRARRLHGVHHMELDDIGRMTKNFGICFFFFDGLFGTFAAEYKQFNHKGLEAAMRRYAYIFH